MPRIEVYNAQQIFDHWFNTFAYAWEVTRMLQAISRGGDAGGWREQWGLSGFPTYYGSEQISSPNEIPTNLAVGCGTALWVGINGTDSFSQVKRYADPRAAYGDIRAEFLGGEKLEVNKQFWKWGEDVANRVTAFLRGRKFKVYLHGHSYGGAVATVAAILLAARMPTGSVRLMTFGAPKVCGSNGYKPLGNAIIRRYMNFNDPVPALPPSEGEFGIPFNPIKYFLVQAFVPALFQAPGGIMLWPNGRHYPAKTTTLTPTGFQWVFEDKGDIIHFADLDDHFLAEYRRRVLAASDTEPDQEDLEQWFPLWELAIEEYRKFKPIGGQVIAPTESPFVPKAWRAKVAKSGVDWGVVLNGEIVAVHAAKTKCHSLAKAINHFLRRSLLLDPFYTETFITAFRDFTLAAFAGGNGFRPDVADFSPT